MTPITDAWHLILGAGSLLIALARWTARKRSGKPSLPTRLWRWWLTVADREMDNQRLSHRLAAQDALIRTLQSDLDLASGIASSRELHNGDSHHWPSGEPMTHSHPLSATTTEPHGQPDEGPSMLTDRRSLRDRRKGWGRIGAQE